MDSGKRTLDLLRRLAFPLVLAGIGAAFFAWREPLLELSRNPASARAFVEDSGVAAPLAFMALQAFQVLVFLIPGEVVQIAGGYLFGMWEGSLWSTLGILAGSAANFWIGRALGRPFIEWVAGRGRFERLEHATASGKAAAAFLALYALPGFPKDVLTYFAGASGLPFALFLSTSTLGRLPGIVGSSFMGSAAFEGELAATIAVLVAAMVLFALGLVFRDRISNALGEAWRKRRERSKRA
jgi:uncharacterized membrane protein YdjX (TVP38/TMEM64 family)